MNASHEQLRVGIIMGSDSDLGTMKHAGRALTKLGLASTHDYEERVISAHRTPEEMTEYANEAEERGLKVIIAGAGSSGHLPGMIASETILPVYAVAVTNSPDTLNRALGSMIGMPEGKPLATFQGESGAFNAGLAAARVLIAIGDSELRQAYLSYEAALKAEVIAKDTALREGGAEVYLRQQRVAAEIRETG